MIRNILAITAAAFSIAAQADEVQSGVQNPGTFAPVVQTVANPLADNRATDEILSGATR
jgi:hypothetical protein